MKEINNLKVILNGRRVGTLAVTDDFLVAFQYDNQWLLEGFSINPLSLPLSKKVFFPKPKPFDGLFGVFDDSLPDGWGRLLVDRLLLANQMNPEQLSSIDRLAIVGSTGMGALEYVPEIKLGKPSLLTELDQIAEECERVLKTDYSDDLDSLFQLGGSSGGARPKILTKYRGEEWMIKFPSSTDGKEIGQQEYQYAQCAKACGIEMTDVELFPSKKCGGYFGTKRFDRIIQSDGSHRKVHMVSAGGLLESSHRIPNLDYNILMKLTQAITNSFIEIEKLYRLMCFNVFAHNRDDHSRNFTFLYSEDESQWKLSPAYDLTYSDSIGGEHATCVNGNGKNPGMEDVLAVAEKCGIGSAKAQKIADHVKTMTKDLY